MASDGYANGNGLYGYMRTRIKEEYPKEIPSPMPNDPPDEFVSAIRALGQDPIEAWQHLVMVASNKAAAIRNKAGALDRISHILDAIEDIDDQEYTIHKSMVSLTIQVGRQSLTVTTSPSSTKPSGAERDEGSASDSLGYRGGESRGSLVRITSVADTSKAHLIGSQYRGTSANDALVQALIAYDPSLAAREHDESFRHNAANFAKSRIGYVRL